jgi:hypothetical protein
MVAPAQAGPKRRGFFFQGEANERGHFGRAPRKLFRRLQIADAGDGKQRQDVRQIVFVNDNDAGFSERNFVVVGHFIFFTVGHSD